MNKHVKVLLVCLFAYHTISLRAQEVPLTTDELLNLSLEELMNIKIESASKKSENLFDSPFSASVLTKEEIKKAGCTSLMEAFRLMPGIIVREQSNGNFDIHLRGLDNVPPNSVMVNSANNTTLVMIDNRPVYNYLQGGTFWETLPIDLNDIERIEVVRGPSSAMYGPNAVSGVINILTRKIAKDGLYTVANAQYGSFQTLISNASVGYQFNPKLNAIVSGNYQHRNRHQTSYYEVGRDIWVDNPDSLRRSKLLLLETDKRYPHQALAMDKYGVNAFINYAPSERIQLNIATGLQDSEVQKAYSENLTTPLTTATSSSRYVDVKGVVGKFITQISYLGGTQDADQSTGQKYDFNTLDVYAEYAFKIKNLVIKPGLNYRKANYNDTKYWDTATKEGFISGDKDIITEAAFVRSEYHLFNNKLRFFGGIRVDKFNYPNKYFLSYQLSANYKFNEKHMVRLVNSRANRSPFVYDTYLDIIFRESVKLPSPPFPPDTYVPLETYLLGNKNLKLVTSNMLELAYRGKLAENLQVDVEMFGTQTSNYTELIVHATNISNLPLKTEIRVENIPMKVRQLGSTVSLNYILSKFQFKPFVTYQHTQLMDYSYYFNSEDAVPSKSNANDPSANNVNSGIGTRLAHKGTPTFYGGAFLNYQVHSKININLNPYFYGEQTFFHRKNLDFLDGTGRGTDKIASKVLLNARVAYTPVKQVSIFVSAKNLLNDTSREFYRTDVVRASYLAGVNFEL